MPKLTLLTPLLLILFGCATTSDSGSRMKDAVHIDMQSALPDIEISESRSTAAGFALTIDLSVYLVCRTCTGLFPRLSQRTVQTKAAWDAHNFAYVNTAGKYHNVYVARKARNEGVDIAKTFYIATSTYFSTTARKVTVELLGPPEQRTQQRCSKVLENIEQGKLDLANNDKFSPILEQIKKDILEAEAQAHQEIIFVQIRDPE